MRFHSLFVSVILLAVVSLGYAQGGFFFFSDAFPLTKTCKGKEPLPDSTPVYIYNDTDKDGPDDTDPLATICAEPPKCETGPGGSLNFNRFVINGKREMELPGCFAIDPIFVSIGAMPEFPQFYLRAMYAETLRTDSGTVEKKITWTSVVHTMMEGPPVDADLGSAKMWTCSNSVRLLK